MKKVEMGDRVQDKISSLKGIVTGITEYLYGCRRVMITPEENKDGKPAESFYIDEPQCEVLKKAVIEAPDLSEREPPHGARRDVPLRTIPKR